MPALHIACGACRECLTGWEALCPQADCHGYSADGCFAEYVRVRSSWVASVPAEMDPVAAAPLMCAGLTAFGAVRKSKLSPGRRAAVFGCGGLGLYAIQLAKIAVPVWSRSISMTRSFTRRSPSAPTSSLPPDEDVAPFIRDLGGADACLNFATAFGTWQPMMRSQPPPGAGTESGPHPLARKADHLPSDWIRTSP
jgi:propanol-preferring alcohol dehydrogenase